jgi:hypothetical protein
LAQASTYNLKVDSRLQRIAEEAQRLFSANPESVGIDNLGVDASLDEDEDDPETSFFQFQLGGLVGSPKGPWREDLKALCNSSEVVSRPVYDSSPRYLKVALAYGLKSEFVRRVPYFDEDRFQRHACRNT